MILVNWKDILARAWSVRFMVAAALLSGFEVALPIIQGQLEAAEVVPRGAFAVLSAVVSALALVARVMAQPKGKE